MASKLPDMPDMATPLRVCPWNEIPGIFIWRDCARTHQDSETATRIANKTFQTFTKTHIPDVKQYISILRQGGHISEVHLPLSLCVIFFLFLDELVEVYQNQLEQKDQDIENKLQITKLLCARSINDCWNKGPQELQDLLIEIKNKLEFAHALPQNFDIISRLWSQILNIKYMGNLTLAALFEKGALQNQLSSDDTKIYHFNEKLYAKESLDAKETEENTESSPSLCCSQLSRKNLEQSFCLILKQIANDASWILPELLKKIPPIENSTKLNSDLLAIIVPQFLEIGDPISLLTIKYEKAFRAFIKSIYSININSNEDIKKRLRLLPDSTVLNRSISTSLLNKIKMTCNDKPFLLKNNYKVTVSGVLVKHLEEYRDCHMITRSFLSIPQNIIRNLLFAIIKSNNIWQQCCEKNTSPLLYSQVTPLLPPIVPDNKQAIDDWADSLEPSPKVAVQATKKLKKKPGNPGTPAKKVAQTRVEPQEELPAPQTLALKPLEQLRGKLLSLHKATPSRALRQALWHLDALMVIQGSLPQAKINSPYCLSLVTMVALSSQKVLEQTYRFCLKKECAPLARVHDLRAYHREFDSTCAVAIPIVEKLFLANTWYRYFYKAHARWDSLKMNLAQTPPLLNLLVKIANGQPLSSQELDQFVKVTIEGVRKHTEYLLEKKAILPAQEGFALEAQAPKDLFTKKPPFRAFDPVIKTLEGILPRCKFPPHHLIPLHIKQTLAALKMLKVCQEKISQAKEIATLSLWSVWSLQQLQESMENLLHVIEHFQTGEMSINHELSLLAELVGLDIGSLAGMFRELSYKTRYPAELLIESLPAQIIDDLEVLKQHPEILEGFKLDKLPLMLWANPREDLSLESIAKNLSVVMAESEACLRLKILPKLEEFLV